MSISKDKKKGSDPSSSEYRGRCLICRDQLHLKVLDGRQVLFCNNKGEGIHYQIGLEVFELAWEKYDKDETTAKLLVAVLVKGNEIKDEPEKVGQPAPAPDVER